MTRKTKILLGFAILAAVVLTPLVWMTVQDIKYASLDPISQAKQSILIVYAVEKRDGNNESLVVHDVWKDTRKSNSQMIGTAIVTKGAFSHLEPSGVQTPDGAVVFFEEKILDKKQLEPYFFKYVNGGKIEGMTLDEYKKACGL
jgi:hypothetical protein